MNEQLLSNPSSSNSASRIPIKDIENRAVTARFLEHFTYHSPHSDKIRGRCTKFVVNTVVKPDTERLKCRYTELPSVQAQWSPHIGLADFFVSHAWGGTYPDFADLNNTWGKLVDAVVAHSKRMQVAVSLSPTQGW